MVHNAGTEVEVEAAAAAAEDSIHKDFAVEWCVVSWVVDLDVEPAGRSVGKGASTARTDCREDG